MLDPQKHSSVAVKYRGTVLTARIDSYPIKTESHFEFVDFDDPDLAKARSEAFFWFEHRVRQLEQAGRYVIPFAPRGEFIVNDHEAHWIDVSFVVSENGEEFEYGLLGFDDQTVSDTLKLEESYFGDYDPPPIVHKIKSSSSPYPVIKIPGSAHFFIQKRVNQIFVHD